MNTRFTLLGLILTFFTACGATPQPTPPELPSDIPVLHAGDKMMIFCPLCTYQSQPNEYCQPAIWEAGKDRGCNTMEMGFEPPSGAAYCDLFDKNTAFQTKVAVSEGKYYCTRWTAYVRCEDKSGLRMKPKNSIPPVCGFEGETPSCPGGLQPQEMSDLEVYSSDPVMTIKFQNKPK